MRAARWFGDGRRPNFSRPNFWTGVGRDATPAAVVRPVGKGALAPSVHPAPQVETWAPLGAQPGDNTPSSALAYNLMSVGSF